MPTVRHLDEQSYSGDSGDTLLSWAGLIVLLSQIEPYIVVRIPFSWCSSHCNTSYFTYAKERGLDDYRHIRPCLFVFFLVTHLRRTMPPPPWPLLILLQFHIRDTLNAVQLITETLRKKLLIGEKKLKITIIIWTFFRQVSYRPECPYRSPCRDTRPTCRRNTGRVYSDVIVTKSKHNDGKKQKKNDRTDTMDFVRSSPLELCIRRSIRLPKWPATDPVSFAKTW